MSVNTTALCGPSDPDSVRHVRYERTHHTPMWTHWSRYNTLVYVMYGMSIHTTPLCGPSDPDSVRHVRYECTHHTPMWAQWSRYNTLVYVMYGMSVHTTPLCGTSDPDSVRHVRYERTHHTPMWAQWSRYNTLEFCHFYILSNPRGFCVSRFNISRPEPTSLNQQFGFAELPGETAGTWAAAARGITFLGCFFVICVPHQGARDRCPR